MSKELMIERIEKSQEGNGGKKGTGPPGKISSGLSFYGRNRMDQ